MTTAPLAPFLIARAAVSRLTRGCKSAILLAVDVMAGLLAAAALCAARGLLLSPLDVALIAGAICGGAVLLRLHRIKLNAYETDGVVRSAGLAAATSALVTALADGAPPIARMVDAGLFGLVFLALAVAARAMMLRVYLLILRAGLPTVPVIVYGAGDTGLQLLAALRRHDCIRPVAFVDDDPELQGMTLAGLRVHSPADAGGIARQRGVDRIILAMPSLAPARAEALARGLQVLGFEVQTVPSFAQLIAGDVPVDRLLPVSPGRFLGRAAIDPVPALVAEVYAGRSVMVTGAGGSIGAELARQLVACRPACLVLFDHSEAALYAIDKDLRRLAGPAAVRIVPVLGSVTDPALVEATLAAEAVDVVFHSAAYKHVPMLEENPVVGATNNVLGTRTVAEAALAAGISRFILVSTDKAVRPGNVMGATKRLAEMIVQDLARRSRTTRFSVVRFGNVLGSSGSVVPLFHEQIARGGPVTLTHDDVTRYFMTLAEAAGLLLASGAFHGDDHSSADVLVLDMGRPMRIRDLAVQMIEAAGQRVCTAGTAGGGIEIRTTGLRPGEKLHEELLIDQALLPTPHPAILRARESGLSAFEIQRALHQLRAAIARNDARETRRLLFRWVEPAQDAACRANAMTGAD